MTSFDKIKTAIDSVSAKRILAHTAPGFLLFLIFFMGIDSFIDTSTFEKIQIKNEKFSVPKIIGAHTTEINRNTTTPIGNHFISVENYTDTITSEIQSSEKTVNTIKTIIRPGTGDLVIENYSQITTVNEPYRIFTNGTEIRFNQTSQQLLSNSEINMTQQFYLTESKTVSDSSIKIENAPTKMTFLIMDPSSDFLNLQILIVVGLLVGGILGIVLDGVGHYVFEKSERPWVHHLEEKGYLWWTKIMRVSTFDDSETHGHNVGSFYLHNLIGISPDKLDDSDEKIKSAFRVHVLKDFYSFYEFYRNSGIALIFAIPILPYYLYTVLQLEFLALLIAFIGVVTLSVLLLKSASHTLDEFKKRRLAMFSGVLSAKATQTGILTDTLYVEPKKISFTLSEGHLKLAEKIRIISRATKKDNQNTVTLDETGIINALPTELSPSLSVKENKTDSEFYSIFSIDFKFPSVVKTTQQVNEIFSNDTKSKSLKSETIETMESGIFGTYDGVIQIKNTEKTSNSKIQSTEVLLPVTVTIKPPERPSAPTENKTITAFSAKDELDRATKIAESDKKDAKEAEKLATDARQQATIARKAADDARRTKAKDAQELEEKASEAEKLANDAETHFKSLNEKATASLVNAAEKAKVAKAAAKADAEEKEAAAAKAKEKVTAAAEVELKANEEAKTANALLNVETNQNTTATNDESEKTDSE